MIWPTGRAVARVDRPQEQFLRLGRHCLQARDGRVRVLDGELTEAADWYAMGVMIFQALSGRLPFTTRGRRLLEHKATRDPPALA